MGNEDPLDTQLDPDKSVASGLSAAEFEDVQEIGRGGFGVVYRCTQPGLDRMVAVKVLTDALNEENQQRFLREQRAMGRLSGHPNIVNVLHVGTTESGRPYIVMQYHPRDSVEVQIRRHGPLALSEVLRLGVKVAGALETAHHLGILHRDVKPANILLTDYGEPVLTDFGIAHIAGGFKTSTGTVTGSPAFTAPEVLAGGAASVAADIYGLGATLFAAITGHAAFERRSGEQLIAQFLRITTEPVPDLHLQGIPADVSEAVEWAMSRDPQARPSAAAFGEALREIQLRHGLPVDAMAMHPGVEVATGRERASGSGGSPRNGRHVSAFSYGRSTKGNLPLELTSFIGRRSELTEVRSLLSVSRLVTLTGIGGVGKTRLAMRVAGKVQHEFSGGVWLVELGEFHDDHLLVDVIAGALGLRDQSATPVREILVDFLATRELLLVLDNCEHMVDAVAELAEALLQTCPGLRILATSREPLEIGGEAAVRVPPLTVPDPDHAPSLQRLPRYDAVTLFAERAIRAEPTFALTDDNRVAVARICHRLDGLPLPIELAAARLRAMTPEQILDRLNDRYALLTRGGRGAPSRQQTLRGCIDWSYALCSAQERQMWGRLSVFAGTFELDAAGDICGSDLTPEELLDVVTSLVDKSILTREESHGVVRFGMLETLLAYGREKAQESGEFEELRRRHRDWYHRLALDAEADWISSRQAVWIALFKQEKPNLREAMEFCLSDDDNAVDVGLQIAAALYWPWACAGFFGETQRWLDRLLARGTDRASVSLVKALVVDSLLAGYQGDLQDEADLVERARPLAEQIQDPMAGALVAHADGVHGLFSGDLVHACPRLEEALVVFRDVGHVALQVEALWMLGMAYGLLGEDPDRSIDWNKEALAITESRGEPGYRGYVLWSMGVAQWRNGNRSRATDLLHQALRLLRLVDDPGGVAHCLEALAWIAGSEGEPRRAGVLLGSAETIGRAVGVPPVYVPKLLVYHEECVRATRQALGGPRFESARKEGAAGFEAVVAYELGERAPQKPSDASVNLTKRELEVGELVAEGLTNKEIAARLVISLRTAQGHVEHLLTKLGFNSRAQIAAWIVEQRQSP
ncbi:protein kinase [Nocardia sp. NPDC059239]|uniref:protein kinase domain-containing protein n=1 Tax=unclassified Nocardia TaxID=2637762 RepID=UPI003686AC7E